MLLKTTIQYFMLSSFLIIFFFYLGYFLFLYYFYKKHDSDESFKFHYPYVSFVIPVYNEEKIILKKIQNIEKIIYPKEKIDVIFVDGCSTDNTTTIINNYIENNNYSIKLIQENKRGGYNNGISKGISNSRGEIIVVTDAAAYYYPDTMKYLVQPFNDCKIGAVTGKEIVLSSNEYDLGPKLESIYRTFYDFMRISETRIDSTPDSKGELLAIKKDICLKILSILESSPNASFDSCVPYQAKLEGYRTVYQPKAKYYEYAPATFMDRMKQQIRRGSLLIGSMLLFKKMLFKKKYGAFSLIIMPAHFIMMIILPWLVLLGTVLFVMSCIINPVWLFLLIIPLTTLFFNKSRLFLISFIQSQIALIFSTLKVASRRGSLFIDTIKSTRN